MRASTTQPQHWQNHSFWNSTCKQSYVRYLCFKPRSALLERCFSLCGAVSTRKKVRWSWKRPTGQVQRASSEGGKLEAPAGCTRTKLCAEVPLNGYMASPTPDSSGTCGNFETSTLFPRPFKFEQLFRLKILATLAFQCSIQTLNSTKPLFSTVSKPQSKVLGRSFQTV